MMRMARRSLHSLSARLDSLAHYDFCPWANRYVYWLKEPVGWFVLALVASLLVGAFLSPLGWSVAAGLATVILLGLGFPWLATRAVRCQLRPLSTEMREREAGELALKVTNYLPLPLTGLCLEGYIPSVGYESVDGVVGKACVLGRIPAFSRATYHLPLNPEYRGRYPQTSPQLTCAFPFGIWTARRTLENWQPVLVLPLCMPLLSDMERTGNKWADHGVGMRPSSHGDFLGVREFRSGDSLKSIHWAQSAKHDRWVVCERGGPQQQPVDVRLSTTSLSMASFSTGQVATGSAANRENLAWRVRVAASLIELLCGRQIPFRLLIDGRLLALPSGAAGAKRASELLAELPVDGPSRTAASVPWPALVNPCIAIHAQDSAGQSLAEHLICVELQSPSGLRSQSEICRRSMINLDRDIDRQLEQLLSEANLVSQVA